jgi:hypothetical protein
MRIQANDSGSVPDFGLEKRRDIKPSFSVTLLRAALETNSHVGWQFSRFEPELSPNANAQSCGDTKEDWIKLWTFRINIAKTSVHRTEEKIVKWS